MQEAARTLKRPLPKPKLKMCAFGVSACKPGGRRRADHHQHKDHPCQGTDMKTSSPPEGLRFREIKRPGSPAPGNGETRWRHMRACLAAARAGPEARLHWPSGAGSHRASGGEAAAGQHQRGAARPPGRRLLLKQRGTKGRAVDVQPPGSHLETQSSAALMEGRICSKTVGTASGMQSE